MTKVNTDNKKIKELLERGVDEVIKEKDLDKKLKSGKRLRVKFGINFIYGHRSYWTRFTFRPFGSFKETKAISKFRPPSDFFDW